MARRALVLDPRHPGAIHVIAHVMEMQGRAREGLAFLAATESAWIEGTDFSVHLAWHRALFHLDSNDLESALATYDAQIANARAHGISVLARVEIEILRRPVGTRHMSVLPKATAWSVSSARFTLERAPRADLVAADGLENERNVVAFSAEHDQDQIFCPLRIVPAGVSAYQRSIRWNTATA